MNEEFKQPIFPIGLMLIYIILGTLGLYSILGIFAAPFFSIPLVIYMLKRNISIGSIWPSFMITAIGIFVMRFDLNQVLIYLLGVVLVTQIIIYLYRNGYSLPTIIMYGTVFFTAAVLVYVGLLAYLGVDYAAAYRKMCEGLKQVYTNDMSDLLAGMGISEAQLGMSLSEVWTTVIEILKQLFPAYIVVQNFTHMAIAVLICNFIVRRRNHALPSIKQLMEFKLSKAVLPLFFIAFVILLTVETGGELAVFSMNVLFILMGLLGIVGALGLLGLIYKSRLNKGIKALGYLIWIGLTLVGAIVPIVYIFFVLFACFDTIFNYRKVSIVV